jgi:hypothetical protein
MAEIQFEGVKSYPLMCYGELAALDPPRMLIQDLLVAESITGISGKPGCGKTWLIFEIMRAVAFSGMQGIRPFLGHMAIVPHPSDKPYTVLFVGSDASIYDYAFQFRRLIHKDWEKHFDPTPGVDDVLLNERMRFLVQSDFSFDNFEAVERIINTSQGYRYETGSDWDWAANEGEGEEVIFHETGFDLIIFDTFASMNNLDRNDNTQMETVYRAVRSIADRTGAALILTNHSTKSDDDWIGAISQVGRLDSLLRINHVKGSRDLREVKFKKFRGITPPDFRFRLNVQDRKTASLDYVDIVAPRGLDTTPQPADDRALVLELLSVGPQTTRALTAAKQASFTPSTSTDAANRVIQRLMKALAAEGLVQSTPGELSTDPSIWSLVTAPTVTE